MVTITTRLPETGLELPSPAELARLRKIVLAAHPWLRDGAPAEREFVRAFWAAGMAFRTASPCRSRSFAAFVDDACELLTQYGSEGVGGSAFMAACLAHGDICWQKPDATIGALLEIGLNAYQGGKCANAWRDILAGKANLLSPTPRPERLTAAQSASPTRIYREDRATGEMREVVADDGSLWR